MTRATISCLWMLASCGGSRTVIVHVVPAPAPAEPTASLSRRTADSGKARELVQQSVFGPLRALFNSPGIARNLAGMHAEAYNVTSEDDVVGSGWFAGTSRATAEPPDTSAAWTVVGGRLDGAPVLAVRDARGHEYWLTFDTPEYPELATATEVIAARLYEAAGFHAPQVWIVTFDPERQLALGDTGTARAVLAGVARRADGRLRTAAHFVAGRVLGTFAFAGHRADDPADTLPHEHRRELRGLYVVAAWLDHTGLFRGSTLDVLVDTAGGRTVRHYVLGFESSLGSRNGRPSTARAGTEGDWDSGKVATRLLTLGFYAAAWERSNARRFDPLRWTPSYPNPAFARRTARDGFWGAKLVAGISDATIRQAVAAGELGDSAVGRALVDTVRARRALTVARWFSRVTPLDELAIRQGATGSALAFRDLGVAEELVPPQHRRYEIVMSQPGDRRTQRASVTLDLSADGRGVLPLPALQGEDAMMYADWPVERQLGWIDVRAVADDGTRPRVLRIYVLPDSTTGYRIVGRRY